MLMDLRMLRSEFRLQIKGIIHIGGHYGEEHPIYLSMGIEPKDIIYFEPLEKNFRVLQRNVFPSQAYKIALGNTNGFIEMFVENANNGQSSSCLEPNKHLEVYPNIQFPDREQVPICRLDDIIITDESRFNFINIDVQGFELEVFKGSVEFLKHVDYIMTEINFDELYTGCVQAKQLDDFLYQQGFVRVKTFMAHETWGDALYIKYTNQ